MNTQLILFWLLLPCWALASTRAEVAFTTNPVEAQARALREEKLYFVHFTATWCVPCKWVEENTFVNDTLATFVADHYLAVRLDFDDPGSAVYKKRYQVTSLPSLLIFNDKGELIDRYATSLSKDELLQILQKHTPAQRHRNPLAVKVAHTNSDKISRPALIPEEAKAAEKTALAAPKTPQLPPMETPLVSAFGVQVGVYSDLANAERTRVRMSERFAQPAAIVEIWQNGKKLYKVMVGKFAEKDEAEVFLQQLSAQSVPGFVKNWH